MLHRKQVADLLSALPTHHVSRGPQGFQWPSLLEAIYSGADDASLRIMSEYPDLRARLQVLQDIQTRLDTELVTWAQQLNELREKLDPEVREARLQQESDASAYNNASGGNAARRLR